MSGTTVSPSQFQQRDLAMYYLDRFEYETGVYYVIRELAPVHATRHEMDGIVIELCALA